MRFSNEWKSAISRHDVMTLDHRLSAVTRQDYHAGSGSYVVHSLYFEEMDGFPRHIADEALRKTERFRIRYYDDNLDLIKLEKKSESNGTSVLEDCEITREFLSCVLNRDFSNIVKDPWGRTGEDLDPLIQEFYWNLVGRGMTPRMIVDYSRKPYIYPHGDVRVTIDTDFKTSTDVSGFMNPGTFDNIPGDGRCFIKVKWNSYLPEMIRSTISLINRKTTSYYLYEPLKMFV